MCVGDVLENHTFSTVSALSPPYLHLRTILVICANNSDCFSISLPCHDEQYANSAAGFAQPLGGEPAPLDARHFNTPEAY